MDKQTVSEITVLSFGSTYPIYFEYIDECELCREIIKISNYQRLDQYEKYNRSDYHISILYIIFAL